MLLLLLLACGGPDTPVAQSRNLATPDTLAAHCRDEIGEPRVEEVAPGVFVARSYDLANTIVIQTDDGRVVVDAGMSPPRSAVTRAALDAVTTGPVRAVVFTHSHIDHVGGAAVWMEEGTEVWATEAFTDHFFKQYSMFLPAESARGARQFGVGVSLDDVPCSGLGRQADVVAALEFGVVLPDHTFRGSTSLDVGSTRIELVEAHGETDDQLFVWLPEREVLLPGDNIYTAFPNLYTIRGTRRRPTDAWVRSLDAMRRLDPGVLVPSHTSSTIGRDAVRERLRVYRDGIQWVHDEVVRGANRGSTPDELAATIGLPPSLADEPALAELYGQIDWSVRAIYDGELGWFDGRASQLYTLPPKARGERFVAAMGGEAAVRAAVASSDDPRWTLELLELLEASGATDLDALFADAQEAVAAGVANTNGRAYLLKSAAERRAGAVPPLGDPKFSDDFVRGLPIEAVLDTTAIRLRPAQAQGVHESLVLAFTDHDPAVLTVRNGVLEVVWGDPLPGTPIPVATAAVDTVTWKQIGLGIVWPLAAMADGRLKVDDSAAFKRFMDRFVRGLPPPAERVP